MIFYGSARDQILDEQLNHLLLGTTVCDSDLEDGRVCGGDHRETLGLVFDYEAAGSDGRVRV